MYKRWAVLISLAALLAPVTAFPAETAQVFLRYLEFAFDGNQDTAELLKQLSDGKDLPEAPVEFSTFAVVPAGGEDPRHEMYVQSTEPRTYPEEGFETIGRAGFTISVVTESMPDGKWSLVFSVESGEYVPYSDSRVGEDGSQYSIQRSRLVGFTVEMETILLKTGTQTVIHAEVEKVEDKSVCRVLTAAIYPQGEE